MGCILDNYSIFIHTPVNEWHHKYLYNANFWVRILILHVQIPNLSHWEKEHECFWDQVFEKFG